jgi:hypothetical protein
MQRFRIEFYKFEVKSITLVEEDVARDDPFLERHVGDTIWAVIKTEDRTQAYQKALRFSNNLKTGIVA